MEIKPAGYIPYSEKTWEEFKERLVTTLMSKALNCDQIFEDTDAKNYIVSYVENEVLNEKKDNERLIMNVNLRFSNMEIEGKMGKQVYPIINEYKGHHLFKTYYFYRDEENSIQMGCEEVNPHKIII